MIITWRVLKNSNEDITKKANSPIQNIATSW